MDDNLVLDYAYTVILPIQSSLDTLNRLKRLKRFVSILIVNKCTQIQNSNLVFGKYRSDRKDFRHETF